MRCEAEGQSGQCEKRMRQQDGKVHKKTSKDLGFAFKIIFLSKLGLIFLNCLNLNKLNLNPPPLNITLYVSEWCQAPKRNNKKNNSLLHISIVMSSVEGITPKN